jgi:hypothetical protein
MQSWQEEWIQWPERNGFGKHPISTKWDATQIKLRFKIGEQLMK